MQHCAITYVNSAGISRRVVGEQGEQGCQSEGLGELFPLSESTVSKTSGSQASGFLQNGSLCELGGNLHFIEGCRPAGGSHMS